MVRKTEICMTICRGHLVAKLQLKKIEKGLSSIYAIYDDGSSDLVSTYTNIKTDRGEYWLSSATNRKVRRSDRIEDAINHWLLNAELQKIAVIHSYYDDEVKS